MTIEINAAIIIGFLMALGIPSAITGVLLRRLEKRFDQRELAREKSQTLIVRGVRASISLGQACAIALRDGKSNGETSAALDYANQIKHAMDDLHTEQAIKHIY